MSSQVNTILNILARSTEVNVPLIYRNYRERFNTKAVPPVDFAKDKNNKISMVWINRLQALEWLKKNHNFLTVDELHTELREAANDS